MKLLAYVAFLCHCTSLVCFADNTVSISRDPIALCAKTAASPVVDGRLDDQCWKRQPSITQFVLSKDGGRPQCQTQVLLAYNDGGLFIAFRCFEPETSKLVTGQQFVWRNDSVEVLIDADRDREGYIQLIGDVSGNKFQQLAGIPAETPNRQWNTGWKFAAAKGLNEWTAEVFVPAEALRVPLREGTVIRANFARNRKPVMEASSWTRRTGDIRQALYFGNVLLGSKPAAASAFLEQFRLTRYDEARAELVIVSNGPKTTYNPRIRILPERGIADCVLPRVSTPPRGSVRLGTKVRLPDEHEFGLEIWAQVGKGPQQVYLGSYRVSRAPSFPRVYGSVLASRDWGTVWEADAACKVMPDSPIPEERSRVVRIFAARNEFEPFQIVVTPRRDLHNLRAAVSDLVGPGNVSKERITVRLVETVPVTVPTSPDCAPGNYPDPLVPFDSVTAKAGRNTVLWFTVRVLPDVPAGEYHGIVRISADNVAPLEIPINLRVWGFALPEISRLRTAYGCDYGAICRWHGVSSLEDKRKIATLTNQNFIEHRVCPINPLPYWSFDDDIVDGKMVIIWDEYDRGAELFLPKMNSFNLPGAFMSSVRNKRAKDPGYAEEKKEFLRLVAAHLREKGWFHKGYNYIFDEPDPDQYADIVREAEIWHAADPGFKVLVTEQPEPELFGAIDIWVPVLDAYIRPICQSRQSKGEEVWWYVCCGPHHPYPNNFIDYAGVDHRILHWMNWKYGVTGVLYWQTTFWRSDPWLHPMNDEGGKNLGNGDGTLLYPAVRKPSDKPLLQGPLDSIRWEMIREGIEDYDYFAMLSDAIKTAQLRGTDKSLIESAKKALAEVNSAVKSPTNYEKNPKRLCEIRVRVARALEALLAAGSGKGQRIGLSRQ
ncbi:MAG: DUF4091 domain-containing protein [Armatimonadota bacterium]|nr:DUF4091 domain-containing protein [Armatimonadota bacterium]